MSPQPISDELFLLRLCLRDVVRRGVRLSVVSQWLASGWPPDWRELAVLLAELVAQGLGDRELQPLVDFVLEAEEAELATGMISVAWSFVEDRPRSKFSPELGDLLRNCARTEGQGRALLSTVRAAVAERWLATGQPPAWGQLSALLAELVTAGLGEPDLRPLLDFVLEAERAHTRGT